MLLAIRERAKGWIAWLIICLLAVPFAFFGVYNYLAGSTTAHVAARVNDVEITIDEVSNRYRQERQRLEAMYGDQIDLSMFDEGAMRRDVVEQLINERLLVEFVTDQGIRVSDARLGALIRGQEIFHDEEGHFSAQRYQQLLRNNMLTPEIYEANVRRTMMLEQLQTAVYESALVTEADVERLIRLERQQRDFDYLTVKADTFYAPDSVNAEDIQAYYDNNPHLFQRPEEVRLAYLELDEKALRAQVQVDEEELQQRYQAQRDTRFTEPGEREVRHILITLDQDAPAAEVDQARERLLELREQILAGASFEELAREHSDDPGSAPQGGDLGVIERGMMVEPFEEAAFALDEGELSEPVRTRFGLHLIQATRVEPPQVAPFEQVRAELEEELINERVGNRVYELVEQLGNLTYETPDSLEPAAQVLGLEVQTTDWFSREGGEGIAQDPRVVDAAFSDEVLRQGYNSEPLSLEGRHIVVRLADHRPATRLPLAEVEDQVRNQLARERAQERARELAEQLYEKAVSGVALAELAEADGVELTEAKAVSRNNREHPWAVRDRAFAMSRPEGEARSHAQVAISGGDYAVISLRAVEDGDPTEVSDEERHRYRRLLQRAYGEAAFADLLAQLRQQAKVVIYENRL